MPCYAHLQLDRGQLSQPCCASGRALCTHLSLWHAAGFCPTPCMQARSEDGEYSEDSSNSKGPASHLKGTWYALQTDRHSFQLVNMAVHVAAVIAGCQGCAAFRQDAIREQQPRPW